MSDKRLELALKKQRLQIRSAALREDFAAYAGAWKPTCALFDQGHAALLWLRRHPALPVAALVALLVARPRAVWRWLKRGFLFWQLLGKLGVPLSVKPPLAR